MKFDILSTVITLGFTLISTSAFVALKFSGLDSSISKAMMDTIVPMIVQAWVLNFTVIVQHKYGSSQGSADKDAMIEEILKRLTPSVGRDVVDKKKEDFIEAASAKECLEDAKLK
jgi:hypothetical protein